jgi:fatty-acyl-CoA synthase
VSDPTASAPESGRIGPYAYWPTDLSLPWDDTTVGAALRARAAAAPDATAMYWLEGGTLKSMSYQELLNAALACAARLLAVTEAPGDRVAAWTPNCPEWVVFYYACALSGRVMVPLNPMLSDAELSYALTHSGARALFTVTDFRGRDLVKRAEAVIRDFPGGRILELRRWPDLPAAEGTLPEIAPSAPLLIQYTSGTTGRPKGAVLSHTCAYNNAHLRALLLQPGPHEVWCSPSGFYHVAGSVSRVLGVMSVGGALVVVSEPKGTVVADLMERTRTTHAGLIGKLALDFLDDALLGTRDFSALTSLALGGATVTPDVVQRLVDALGVAVVNGYGQSESPHITGTRADDLAEDRLTTIGRPLPHREVCIMRPGTPNVADLGETGEICTRGRLVMDGYFHDDQATSAAIDAEGWLHTGDLGSMDDRGVLTFRGRLREVIIRGGENIYPVEVETALATCEGVEEVAVVGVPDPRWGAQVAAVVRGRPGAALSADALREHAAGMLAPFKIPRLWRFVPDLPRTASGKVRKNLLLEQIQAELATAPPAAVADASGAGSAD